MRDQPLKRYEYCSEYSADDFSLLHIHQNYYPASADRFFPYTDLPHADHYYYCITGLPKSIWSVRCGISSVDYRRIYDNEIHPAIDQLMKEHHISGKPYMILNDEKLIGIIFQPSENCDISPADFAGKIQRTVELIYGKFLLHRLFPFCNTTALSTELHGAEALYCATVETVAQKELSFFLMTQAVLTKDYIAQVRNHAGYETVLSLCRRICNYAAAGNFSACKAGLERLFLQELKYSFDFRLVSDSLSYFKNFLHIRYTVYDIPDKNALSVLCDPKRYVTIEECVQTLLPTFQQLCYTVKGKKPYTDVAVLAAYYIHTHISEDISLTDMAEYIGVTPIHVSRAFHQQMGQTVKQYQTQFRIRLAQDLLKQGEMKVARIAEAVGIRDVKYFTQLFKKSVGVNPQQYRAENKS